MRQAFRAGNVLVAAAALATFGSGLINLGTTLAARTGREGAALLRDFFPLDFRGVSTTLATVAGFVLVISAGQILNRKRRAFYTVAAIAAASTLFHLTGHLSRAEAAGSLALLAVLAASRREFTVGGGTIALGQAASRAGVAVLLFLGYSVAGFWRLASREFGVNFHWWQALRASVLLLTFSSAPPLSPHTAYARYFLMSLHALAATAVIYAFVVLYRPVRYRFSQPVSDRERAAAIIRRHGSSAQDFFKQSDDKSFFFSKSGECFLAYRVAGAYALALGDPVGPESELEQTVRDFWRFCEAKGWRCGFHQVRPGRLAIYERLGFGKFKVGEVAVVDLTQFSLAGKPMKEFRNTVNRFRRLGIEVRRYDPQIPAGISDKLKAVSDEWLSLPGRRERRFTLGRFEREYVRSTTVYVAVDASGEVLAFLNLIPCYEPRATALDLMRRRRHAPNGVMDFLLAEAFLDLKERGIERFDLGMVPLGGGASAGSGRSERLVGAAMGRMDFLFSYKGLSRYKAKYATAWEPRYDAYRGVFGLPRLAFALRGVTEVPRRERRAS